MRSRHHQQVTSLLEKLSWRKQLAFALLILQRMFPSLVSFSQETGFDFSLYLTAKANAWNAIEGTAIENPVTLRSLSEECAKKAPDTETFSDDLASHALNSALSTANILTFAVDHNLDHILDVIGLTRDSIDLYLQSLDPSPISESGTQRLDQHRLLREEYERQIEDLEFVARLSEDMGQQEISRLRKRAEAQTPLLPFTALARRSTE